jgi:hypothetical protein
LLVEIPEEKAGSKTWKFTTSNTHALSVPGGGLSTAARMVGFTVSTEPEGVFVAAGVLVGVRVGTRVGTRVEVDVAVGMGVPVRVGGVVLVGVAVKGAAPRKSRAVAVATGVFRDSSYSRQRAAASDSDKPAIRKASSPMEKRMRAIPVRTSSGP